MSTREDKDQPTPEGETCQDAEDENILSEDEASGDEEWSSDEPSDEDVITEKNEEVAVDTGNSETSSAESPTESSEDSDKESKVINKGKASLIISGAAEARSEASQPQVVSIEPRIVAPRIEESEAVEEDVPQEIQRLESRVNPGKERIKVDQAKFEKLEQRPDKAEIQEEQWGSSISPGWWVTIAGAVAAVILLGGLAIESWFDGDEAQTVVEAPAYVPEPDPYEGSPEQWFRQRAGVINKEASAILTAFVSAKNDVERSKVVRFPELYLERSQQSPTRINPRIGHTEDQSFDITHTNDTAFLILACQDTDFMPFRAYFTREGEQMKLDWSATTAWCQVSLKKIKTDSLKRQNRIAKILRESESAQQAYSASIKLREKALLAKKQQEIRKKESEAPKIHVVKRGENIGSIAQKYKVSVEDLMVLNELKNNLLQIGQSINIPGSTNPLPEKNIVIPPMPTPVAKPEMPAELYTEPTLVRCMFRRRDEFYAGPYNDQEHSAFMLLSDDRSQYMWAYTKRNSPLDLELRALLDHGRFVVDLKKDIRVTLRVKRSEKDALPSQLELVELVHPEWVTP